MICAGTALAQAGLAPPKLGDVQPAAPEQASPGEMPDVTISARLERPEIPLNEVLVYVIELNWDKKLGRTAELDFDFPDPPVAAGLTPVGNSFRTVTELEGDVQHVLRQYTYEYQPKQEGITSLEPAVVTYRRRGAEDETSLETGALDVTILPPKMDIKDMVRGNAAKIIIALVLVTAAAVLAVITLRERKRKAPPEPVTTETIEESYLNRLKENETLRIAGRWADYFLGLSGLLKGYLGEKYGIRTQAQTTDRLVESVRQKLGDDTAKTLREFFLLCDRVKFAGHQPGTTEMDRAYETARSIIKLGESSVEKTEETGG